MKVPAISEAQNFAWSIFLPSLNCGTIGESHSRCLGRFNGRNVYSVHMRIYVAEQNKNKDENIEKNGGGGRTEERAS